MVHLLWAHDLTDHACALEPGPTGHCSTAASRVLHGGGGIGAVVVRFSGGGMYSGCLPNPAVNPVLYLAGELCERDRGHTNLVADAPTAIPNIPGWPSGKTRYMKSERRRGTSHRGLIVGGQKP